MLGSRALRDEAMASAHSSLALGCMFLPPGRLTRVCIRKWGVSDVAPRVGCMGFTGPSPLTPPCGWSWMGRLLCRALSVCSTCALDPFDLDRRTMQRTKRLAGAVVALCGTVLLAVLSTPTG